jgi:hypothetical protein
MGRLTLNVLLSFAQFEREVTSERIRDKIAASKRKGLWVGGMAPLGYDTKDRKITVNDAEADRVRTIFRSYLDLGNLNLLMADLHKGSPILGPKFGRSPRTIFALLTCASPTNSGAPRARRPCGRLIMATTTATRRMMIDPPSAVCLPGGLQSSLPSPPNDFGFNLMVRPGAAPRAVNP